MRRRLLKMMIAAAALAATVLPAQAGPYGFSAQNVLGASAVAELQSGGLGYAFLYEVDYADYRYTFQIFPQPSEGFPPTNYTIPPAKVWYGCIAVIKPRPNGSGSTIDGGCELSNPPTVTVDPDMGSGTIIFSVLSARPDGNRLTATLLLEGKGDVQRVSSVETSLVQSPTSPSMYGEGNLGLARAAFARGAIRSDVVGGGAVTSNPAANFASLLRGAVGAPRLDEETFSIVFDPGVSFDLDRTKPLCIFNPPQCPLG